MSAKTVTTEEGTQLDVMGDAVPIILRCEDTGGSLTLVQQRSRPGAGIPRHVNTREDEVFQVLEGRVEFQVGVETLTAEARTVVHVPKHLPHSFHVVGDGFGAPPDHDAARRVGEDDRGNPRIAETTGRAKHCRDL